MRRRVLWMLVALTAVLLWAGGVACTGDSIEPAAQQDEQRLRDGAAAQPPSFALELESSREPCTAGTPTEISWAISGGTPPYTLAVDGADVEPEAGNVQINCGALTEAEAADEDAALAAKTVTAVVTDSRGIRREATLNIARTRILAPILSGRTAASGSVALSWSGGPAVLTRWEYRQRQAGGSWGAWTTISGGDASTVEHTVSGLTMDARYYFQLRVVEAAVFGPASEAAGAVAGLTPTASSGGWSLHYDDLDSEDEAREPGAYVFLTDTDDLTSGATTFAEASGAEALLLSVSGYRGRDYADVLSTVQVGDRFTWVPYPRCWYQYRVTAILTNPSAPARKLLRIALVAQEPCHAPAARAGNAKSYFDEFHDILTTFDWNLPSPNEPKIGADGVRILPDNYPVEGGYAYRLSERGVSGPVVIDVPAGMRLIGGVVTEDWAARLKDEASGALLSLDFFTGRELNRWGVPVEQSSGSETRDVGALFDAIVASARRQPER